MLGARITSWSPVAGRSVKRSGLRDTGGLYLVSVRCAATGNIHRAVGSEFVLTVNDIVYFLGLIEGFGKFCHEHGLELITNESLEAGTVPQDFIDEAATSPLMFSPEDNCDVKGSFSLSDDEESLHRINLMTGTNRMTLGSLSL